MKRFFFIVLVALAACEAPVGMLPDQQIPLPQMPIIGDDTCHAAPHVDLIGQPATALERVLILGQVRVIRPGMPVTADYRSERINFDISEDQRIRRIWCG
ncbi:MAG: I78 family peptidase inhibitor [Octadecabacter sp.]